MDLLPILSILWLLTLYYFTYIVKVGLFFQIVGIILVTIWIIRKKKGKRVGIFNKFFAIANSVLGMFMFVWPCLAVLGVNAHVQGTQLGDKIALKSITQQVAYDPNNYEFSYKDVSYQRSESLRMHKKLVSGKPDMALVFGSYHEKCYEYRSETGDTFIICPDKDYIYIPSERYQEIEDYYINDAPKTYILVEWEDCEYTGKEMVLDFDDSDYERFCRASEGPHGPYDIPGDEKMYALCRVSSDRIYWEDRHVIIKGDKVMIPEQSYSNDYGTPCPDDLAEKIKSAVK